MQTIDSTSQDTPGVRLTSDGRVNFSGKALKLFKELERDFLKMAQDVGAQEHAFPSLIPRDTLIRAGYFESFPNGATIVTAPGLAIDCVLSPAVCYHCYPLFAEVSGDQHQVWTCQGKCYRHEQGRYEGLARLWEFTMREIVFCGPAEWVHEQRDSWMQRVLNFAAEMGLAAQFVEASDPFYGTTNRGQLLLQKLKKLKYELRLDLANGTTTAAASFNLHADHFAKRFNICSSSGQAVHTGCVAFGLERWVLALMQNQ